MARLEARDLYRFYHSGEEETAALKGVDLSLSAGEFVALVGPSGSGKSTLLACLAGLDIPDGGSVLLDGTAISRRSEAERAGFRARYVGMLMQSGNLIEHLTVADNVALPAYLAGRRGASGRRELLDRLGLALRAPALPSELSGGETARAGLAVALSAAPVVLICDEPTAEVDTETERAVVDLLQEEAARGTAVLVATHSDVLASRAHRIVRLDDGRVVG